MGKMELESINLGNGVILFKNVFKNHKKAYDFALKSKNNTDEYFKWENWDIWGNKSRSEPKFNKSYKTSISYGAELQKESLDIFFKMVKHYKENFLDEKYFSYRLYDKNVPESYEEIEKREDENKDYTIEDLVIFEANSNIDKDWHMHPHQDLGYYWWGANRLVFNCNIYLNDDYEGGEIVFYKYNDKKINYIDSYSGKNGEAMLMEDVFTYKPQAGDALLIQSNSWHSVLPMKNNTSKYYVRQILSGADHPDKFKYLSQPELDFNLFFKNEEFKENKKRRSPVHFSSIDNIDFDSEKYDKQHQIPFVVKNYKNLLENIGE